MFWIKNITHRHVSIVVFLLGLGLSRPQLYLFYQPRHPKHSFIAIEAVNRGLSTHTSNCVLTFSEFPIFNENVVYYCDFVYFLIFSDFWKGGSLKIRENKEIDQIQRGSAKL